MGRFDILQAPNEAFFGEPDPVFDGGDFGRAQEAIAESVSQPYDETGRAAMNAVHNAVESGDQGTLWNVVEGNLLDAPAVAGHIASYAAQGGDGDWMVDRTRRAAFVGIHHPERMTREPYAPVGLGNTAVGEQVRRTPFAPYRLDPVLEHPDVRTAHGTIETAPPTTSLQAEYDMYRARRALREAGPVAEEAPAPTPQPEAVRPEVAMLQAARKLRAGRVDPLQARVIGRERPDQDAPVTTTYSTVSSAHHASTHPGRVRPVTPRTNTAPGRDSSWLRGWRNRAGRPA